jgi:signal transduction histidine kinase
VDRVDIKRSQAELLLVAPGAYARVVVKDDGVGMSESVRRRLFEPLFTTKPAGAGTGLGLSVVDGLVRGHHGAIEVESAPERGSRFAIYLPVERADH